MSVLVGSGKKRKKKKTATLKAGWLPGAGGSILGGQEPWHTLYDLGEDALWYWTAPVRFSS